MTDYSQTNPARPKPKGGGLHVRRGLIALVCMLSLSFQIMYAQDATVTVNLKDVSVLDLFKEIKKQTGYKFIYNEDYLTEVGKISVNASGKSVKEILNGVFQNTACECKFEKNVIYIQQKKGAVKAAGEVAKKVTIKGKVTDEAGEPLPGTSVMVAGTTSGIATDVDGNYEITFDAYSNSKLLFATIGMQDQYLPVHGKNVINVVMSPDNLMIEEVMVVAYGTTKKEAFTGSAANVKGDKIMRESASAISPESALKGYVAGVRISGDNGQPGTSPSVQIRGIGSISQSTAPLYVIDGVPTSSNQLNSINPNDIESMTVLKDAAATSLYGSRASAGVIIITTKRGYDGKTKFDVSYEHAFSSLAIPKQLKGYYMDGAELTNYSVEALKNYYLYSKKALPGMSDDSKYESLQAEALHYSLQNLNSVAKIRHPDDQLDGKFDYKNMSDQQMQRYITNPLNYDWYDAMFKNGYENKINITARGGSEKLSYYGSLGYVNQSGITEGSYFERFSGRVSVDNQATKFLKLSFTSSLTWSTTENKTDNQGATVDNPISSLGAMNPTLPIYNGDGTPYKTPGFDAKTSNPLESVSLDKYIYDRLSSISNITANVQIAKWLKFTTVNGIDFRYTRDQEIWNPLSVQGEPTDGHIDETRRLYTNMVTSNIFNFNKEIKKHSISALAGYEAKSTKVDYMEGEAQKFPVPRLMYLSNGAKAIYLSGDDSRDKLISWITKADYNYDSKYYASVSYRRDGTSRLLTENRWGNFWSASGAWTITREKFMDFSKNWLDNLRLKLSYGTNGVQPGDYFSSLTLFTISGKYDGNSAMYPSAVGNPFITWETSYTWNAGIDFSLFNGKLKGTVEYYNKLTKDLITDRPISYTQGWSTIKENNGKLRNTGVEVTLDSRNIQNKKFTWETNFNISFMKSTVEQLDKEIISGNYIYKEGHPLYSFYIREWAGVDPATGRSQWYVNKEGERDVNAGTRAVTTDISKVNKVIYDRGYPTCFGGLTNRFTFFGVDVSFLLTFSLGGTLFDSQYDRVVLDGKSLGAKSARFDALENAWKKPGDNAENPIIISTDPYGSNYTSTRGIMSSNHLKIKNFSVGYTLPEKISKKVGLSLIRVYLNGSDLYTFFGKDYINPEVSNSGSYNMYSYPSLRSFRFGINVQL